MFEPAREGFSDRKGDNAKNFFLKSLTLRAFWFFPFGAVPQGNFLTAKIR